MVAPVLFKLSEHKNNRKLTIKELKISEPELVAGMRSGDKNAIDALYSMYAGALYGLIFRIVNDDEFAEDVLQETFIRIWQSFNLYKEEKGRLYTWMSNIARHLALDQIKLKHNRNNARNEDISLIQRAVEFHYHISNNPDIIGIRQMTMNLRPQYRCIIDLLYFKGYTQLEAAQELNIPIGTLKTRLRAAVSNLRGHFNEATILLAI